jgi:hypothetical protein
MHSENAAYTKEKKTVENLSLVSGNSPGTGCKVIYEKGLPKI